MNNISSGVFSIIREILRSTSDQNLVKKEKCFHLDTQTSRISLRTSTMVTIKKHVALHSGCHQSKLILWLPSCFAAWVNNEQQFYSSLFCDSYSSSEYAVCHHSWDSYAGSWCAKRKFPFLRFKPNSQTLVYTENSTFFDESQGCHNECYLVSEIRLWMSSDIQVKQRLCKSITNTTWSALFLVCLDVTTELQQQCKM